MVHLRLGTRSRPSSRLRINGAPSSPIWRDRGRAVADLHESGALSGVLISVTTIPAAANIGVAALGDWDEWVGAIEQLPLNLTAILLAGIGALFTQRRLYARQIAGLPKGESRRRRTRPATGAGTTIPR